MDFYNKNYSVHLNRENMIKQNFGELVWALPYLRDTPRLKKMIFCE